MANLQIDRGTRFEMTLRYKKDGVYKDLVGSTIRFTIKSGKYDEDMDDTTALLAKDVTNGTAEGTVNISLFPNDTQKIPPGNYYYDVKVDENSDGQSVYKISGGRIRIGGSPTNRLSNNNG